MANIINLKTDQKELEERIRYMSEYNKLHGVWPVLPEALCMKDSFQMSNGGTSMFINILCLSGGVLAKTDSQKRLMVFLAECNQSVYGSGTVGFDIVDMPWDKDSFDEDKAFMLKVIEGAEHKSGWEKLSYTPNEENALCYLDKFRVLIEKMTKDDVNEEVLTEWCKDAEEEYPARRDFCICEKHGAYVGIHGCQVCND